MKIEHYHRFIRAKELGLAADAKKHIRAFVASFASFEEKRDWTAQFFEAQKNVRGIRHELYADVIFPVLLEGYKRKDYWAWFWLAKTISNLYGCKSLHRHIEYQTDRDLLVECYAHDPDNNAVRRLLLQSFIRAFEYAVHEWPSGILYAPTETPQGFLDDVRFIRDLDIEGRYREFLNEVEEIGVQDLERSLNLGSS